MSAFDLTTFMGHFDSRGTARKDMVYMARTAEAAERYEDMCKFMRELVLWSKKNTQPLTVEERNLLSVAYKNVIGGRRASWRSLTNESSDPKTDELINEYKAQVEIELDAICKDVLELLESSLISGETSENDEAQVFYLKMAADYYRYLAECVTGKNYDQKATEFYKKAFDIAESELQPTHPIRLGLALNYSVCLYEILKDKAQACQLAKGAFDEAIAKLDKLEESDYKDSTLIMQLLRDNLTLWTSSAEGEEEEN